MTDVLRSLRQQLVEYKRNLHLILERKAEFVLAEDIPLQLIKDERIVESQIIELQRRIESLIITDCPYRGLKPFETEHATVFFGREAAVIKLVEQVEKAAFTAVIGPSGSGKSSLVRAGLLYSLLQSSKPWIYALFAPGRDPLRALSLRLVEWLYPQATELDRLAETNKLLSYFREETLTIKDVLTRVLEQQPDKMFLLLVDQFEEVFTQNADRQAQDQFVSLLLEVISFKRIHVVVVLRADFYAHILAKPRLGAVVDKSLFNVLPLSNDELRLAIEHPVIASGRQFERGLTERILESIAGEPGHLPLLQFALTELWARQTAEGVLTHAAYDELGGVEQALTGYAEQVYNTFNAEERLRVQRVLLQMVQPGEGTTDTRRLTTRAEVGEKNWELVVRLADARLVVTQRESIETAEVAHETLIHNWERLREWMNADRAFRTWQERLRSALRQWVAVNHDEGMLLRGASLAEAEEWLKHRVEDLNQQEQTFVRASTELHERETNEKEAVARRLRRGTAFLGVTSIIALIGAVLAGVFGIQSQKSAAGEVAARQTAEAETVRAERAATEARSRALSSAAQAAEERGDHDLALALALAAVRVDKNVPQAQLVLSELAYESGTRARFKGSGGKVNSVAFSPDGKTFLFGSEDGIVRLWDVKSRQEIRRFEGHSWEVVKVVFSPDGRKIFSASLDKTIRSWDVASGQELHQ